jgi:hypothetical protein
MRVLIGAIITLAFLAMPSVAQKGTGGGKRHATPEQKTDEQKKAGEKLEKDYKAALDRIPNKAYDPWATVRDAPKSK